MQASFMQILNFKFYSQNDTIDHSYYFISTETQKLKALNSKEKEKEIA